MKIKDYAKMYYDENFIRYNHEITKITMKHYQVIDGAVFIAKKGKYIDSHELIDKAIASGAKTIIVDEEYQKKPNQVKVNFIKSSTPDKEYARLFHLLYDEKIKNIKKIAVTGTEGKTTTTTIIYNFLKSTQSDCLLIGSNGIFSYCNMRNEFIKTENTTPLLEDVYEFLIKKNFRYDYLIMEVSSQAIATNRILGFSFDSVILTNIDQDHLDFHHTKCDYMHTKGEIFINKPTLLVLNKDDLAFDYFNRLNIAKVYSYGESKSDFQIKNINANLFGTEFMITKNKKTYRVNSLLIGKFNAYNITAALTVIYSLGYKIEKFIAFINDFSVVSGRMEKYFLNNRLVIVDYAHTETAVKEVFNFIAPFKKNRLITVIGAGGERERYKRKVYGTVSSIYSDYVYFTEDNSRDEKVEYIINDMIKDVTKANYEVIYNRYLAIEAALKNSSDDDIILILGRGSEEEMKGRYTVSFNDLAVVKEIGEKLYG